MIIEKIVLENFMCYAGSNEMEFTEGLNVIIGDNGYGKSKLYDAFYWVMYDQVFVPEKKEFQNTKYVKSKLISDKAIFDAKDGKVSARVNITFRNLEKDNVFILERKYSVYLKDGEIQEANDSEFVVLKKELSYLNSKMVTDEDEKRNIINKILPSDVKDYLWFQGEQVESIIDFNKQDTLTKAINVLSSIKRYDDIVEIARSAAKAASTEYDKEVKRLSKDASKSETLELQKKNVEDKIAYLKKEEQETKENLSRATQVIEDLLSKFTNAIDITKINQEKKVLIDSLRSAKESLNEEQSTFHRRLFKDKWVLKGTEALFDEFGRKYSAFQTFKLERAAEVKVRNELNSEVQRLQTRLPMDVPEPIYVQKMLEEERCLVCDREAKKDTEAWKKIKELVERTPSPTPIRAESTVNNFDDDFKKLYSNGLLLSNKVPGIDSDISYRLKKIQEINSKIRELNEKIKEVDDSLNKLTSNSSQSSDEADAIVAEVKSQRRLESSSSEKLNGLTQQLEQQSRQLSSINEQLKELVTGDIPIRLTEKKKILCDFEEIAVSTRNRVFNNLIAQLEKEANLHYTSMTFGNRSTKGQIRLRRLVNGNFMPEITDSMGNPLRGSNTSNLILVKLSAIMAIISAKSNDGAVSLYSLITDAPTSVFGEDYTIGFCKTVSNVYRQSIVMSKEFYKNQELRNKLMTDFNIKIGKVYMISPSVSESEREDRKSLTTQITPLN